jgi:hypothetical protein
MAWGAEEARPVGAENFFFPLLYNQFMRKPFSVRALKRPLVTGKSIVLLAWWLVAQVGGAWNAMHAQTLPPSTLHGHVLHGATQQPLPDALILAGPAVWRTPPVLQVPLTRLVLTGSTR